MISPVETRAIATAIGTRVRLSEKLGVAATVAMNTASRNGTMMSSAALIPAMMITIAATVSNGLPGRLALSLNAMFDDLLGSVVRFALV